MSKKPTLRQLRLKKVLSIKELAEIAGVAPGTIQRIEEGGSKTLHLATIRKLSAALEVEPTAVAWPGDPLDSAESDEGKSERSNTRRAR